MVIKPLEVNSGSTGGVTAGTTAGESIEVTGLHLRLLEGPGVDLTPESPWVTVDTAGSYTVELIVSNVIGNVATSMAAVVTLTRTHTPALKFSGSSSYADMGGGSFDILDDLTLAAWIKPRSISTYNAIAGQGHFQTSTYGYGLQITQAEGIRFQIRMMSAGYHAIVPYTLDGLWHHVVGVRDGTNIFLYVDGQLADKSTAPLGALGSTRKFGVGAVDHGTSWNYYFKGSIADVQLWNRALSEAEVAAMIGRRLDGDEVGLTGYWPFNEGAGDVAYDLMLQPHDANLVNTTWDFDSVLEFDKDEYIVAPRFYLANLTSGSRLFTNSGELKIDSLPVPEGYNAYQVTQGAAVTAIDPSGWLPAEAPWVNISYDKPATESNLCFYAWYTNTITAVALMRSEANISYTLVPPNARIRTTLMRKLEGDQPTVIEPKDLDSGSSGGLAPVAAHWAMVTTPIIRGAVAAMVVRAANIRVVAAVDPHMTTTENRKWQAAAVAVA